MEILKSLKQSLFWMLQGYGKEYCQTFRFGCSIWFKITKCNFTRVKGERREKRFWRFIDIVIHDNNKKHGYG